MKSKILLISLALAAILSVILHISLRHYAFPEHSIQFDIDQHKVEQNTISLAQQSGMDTSNVRKATIFQIDDQPKTYLEREVGAKEAGELAKKDVNLWYFTTRLFKPLQKEEVYASYAPDGRLVSFAHEIEETQLGERLTKEKAEQLAQGYLMESCVICTRTGFPENWNFIQYTKIDRPNRLDHEFVYERKDYALKEARQRVSIVIAGDKVTEFDEYINVPQSWISSFNKEKSYNNIAQIIAEFFSTLFITFPLIIIFFKKYKEKKLSFKIAYPTAIIMSAVTVSDLLNNFSQYYYSYPNTQSNTIIVILGIFALFVTWILTFITAEITIATTESYFREVFPIKKNITEQIKNVLITPATLRGMWIGACLGTCCFVYELAYYFVGKQFGFWVPADINYSDGFNSVAPWLYPLGIGLLPAINEEIIYRLFAISLFTKFFGSRIPNRRVVLSLAVIISSLAWSFQHSAYPQMPFFVRGIELFVIGIIFSILFLRYGILASISAHYSFNALQMAIFFIDSKSTVNVIVSFVIALLPFLIVVIGKLIQLITGKVKSLEQISENNQIELLSTTTFATKSEVEEITSQLETANPLPRKRKVILIGIALLAITLTIVFDRSQSSGIPNKDNLTNRSIALSEANLFLRSKNTKLQEYKTVVTTLTNSEDETMLSYLKSRVSSNKAQQFIRKNSEPSFLWKVRFFKPLQREEYTVYLNANGTPYTFFHKMDEKAVGAQISEDEALQRATAYLADRIIEPDQFSVIDTQSFKRDNRIDYRFIFEDRRKIGEASRRISIDLIDGDPQNLQSSIKLPENYERKNEQIGTKQLIFIIGGTILGFIIMVLCTTTFFNLYKEKELFKKPGIVIGVMTILFGLISQANNASTFYESYSTDLPVWVYAVFQLIEIPIYIIFTFLLVVFCVNGGKALFQRYIGTLLPNSPSEQRRLLGDGLFLVIVISVIGVCILYLSQSLAEAIFPSSVQSLETTTTNTTIANSLQTFLPAGEGLKAISRSFIAFFIIVVIVCIIRKYSRNWKNVGLLFFGLCILIFFITDWHTQDLFAGLVTFMPVIFYTVIAWKYIVKNNIFFYILTIFYLQVGSSALSFLIQNDNFLKMNGIGFLIIATLPIIIWLFYEKFFNR